LLLIFVVISAVKKIRILRGEHGTLFYLILQYYYVFIINC
jgi:hypothetical protein